MHPDRFFRSLHKDSQTVLQDISCPGQPQSTIRYEYLLFGPHFFTVPLHLILTKHGLILCFIYIYTLISAAKTNYFEYCQHVNIAPPFSLHFLVGPLFFILFESHFLIQITIFNLNEFFQFNCTRQN